jgi:hypothetical protein
MNYDSSLNHFLAGESKLLNCRTNLVALTCRMTAVG